MSALPRSAAEETLQAPATELRKLGKFRIVRELGRGGMGVVYEGFDPDLRRRVALKTIGGSRPGGPSKSDLWRLLRREAQAGGGLQHPNIATVYEYGEERQRAEDGAEEVIYFIAMEFLEGVDLRRHLEERHDCGGRLTLPELQPIMTELLDALGYLHINGIVHRDLKPENIMLAGGRVKVMDFGIARLVPVAATSATLTAGVLVGTPTYMAPEQWLSSEVDARADMYSAGVVLYKLLTGKLPFEGGLAQLRKRVLNDPALPPSKLNPDLPRAFDAVLARALAKQPDDRFQTAAEFKEAVLGAIDVTIVRQRTARKGSWRWMATTAALGALLGVGYSAYSTLRSVPAIPVAVDPATLVISAVAAGDTTRIGPEAMARRQLIMKAAAIYVDPASLGQHGPLVDRALLARGDELIKTVLDTGSREDGKGQRFWELRAEVRVREVQKILNQMAQQARIAWVRNDASPRIGVVVRSQADGSAALRPSTVAENILKAQLQSFGFATFAEAPAASKLDFRVEGEVRFKKLSARLAASGLTIEKLALTSWTVRVVDIDSGEEIYVDTQVPQRMTWATEEQALQDVGGMLAAKFSRNFFLQHFAFPPRAVQVQFHGWPDEDAARLLLELQALVHVLDARRVAQRSRVVIDTQLSGMALASPAGVAASILEPLNRRLGKRCFEYASGDDGQINLELSQRCKAM